jgi:hypothetical protein
MVVVKIIGGLGNQLFQYAAGRCLSLHHQTDLKLDDSGFSSYQLRDFELDAFNTVYKIATEDEINLFCNRTFLKKITDRTGPFLKRTFFRETYFHYNKNFLKYPPNVYLKGYWQSEKYFLPVKDVIQKDLLLKDTFINKITDYASEVKNTETVSVHIRRGDFTNKETQKVHGILPINYYENAIEFMRQKFPTAKFLIFSDDIKWVKQNFKIEKVTIVSGEISKTHLEDFYLMSHCSHNIIANSSFSWWAAYLNPNPNKIVIAPKKWFNKAPYNTKDLIPAGWLTI